MVASRILSWEPQILRLLASEQASPQAANFWVTIKGHSGVISKSLSSAHYCILSLIFSLLASRFFGKEGNVRSSAAGLATGSFVLGANKLKEVYNKEVS